MLKNMLKKRLIHNYNFTYFESLSGDSRNLKKINHNEYEKNVNDIKCYKTFTSHSFV